jgi:hypothetical protein
MKCLMKSRKNYRRRQQKQRENALACSGVLCKGDDKEI